MAKALHGPDLSEASLGVPEDALTKVGICDVCLGLAIANTSVGVPYYNYSIMGTQNPNLIIKALYYGFSVSSELRKGSGCEAFGWTWGGNLTWA